jgi:hypothetical protein
MIVWNKCLSSEQIMVVEHYLIKKWDLKVTLADNHPLYHPPPPNAIAPVGFNDFPTHNMLIWLDATTLKDQIGKTISQ